MSKPYLVIVTGYPGTGKSTLGKHLSEKLRVPVISKDALKERIFDTLGFSDKVWSDKVSASAHRITDYILDEELRAGRSLIVESNFNADNDDDRFRKLQANYDFTTVQVLCWTTGNEAFKRYMERYNSPERHPGHHEDDPPEQIRKYFGNGRREPLHIDGKLIEVDCNDFEKIDFDAVTAEVKKATHSYALTN